jgi:SRSO17 transposase
MSTILDHPTAQALLAETDVEPSTLRSCRPRLGRFLERYLPCFYRTEQRDHATRVIQGKLSGLERKTTEPIAQQAGEKRRPLQLFVGAGQWDDQAVRRELRQHVREEIGSRRAVLVVDGLAVPKKGTETCGVQRQWCGHLGKIENCQVGVFLAYASPRGRALVDSALYLPAEWAADLKRRAKTYVPEAVEFQEKWRLGLQQIRTSGGELPHGWVTGDDEFGCLATISFPHQRQLAFPSE